MKGDLFLCMSEANEDIPSPKRRKWLRRLVVVGVLTLLGVIWLDLHGARWIGAIVMRRALEQAGFGGKFELTGSLRSGLQLETVDLSGKGSLANLTVERVTPDYRWRELFDRRLRGITIARAHLDFDLAKSSPDRGSPARDAQQIAQSLQNIGARLRVLDIRIDNLTVTVRRGESHLLELASSALQHTVGSETFDLSLGAMKDAAGKEWPAQQVPLTWNDDELSVPRIDPVPGLSMRDLKLSLQKADPCAISTRVHLLDASCQIRADQHSTTLDQWRGALAIAPALQALGQAPVVDGVVRSLTVKAGSVMGDWRQASGVLDVEVDTLHRGRIEFSKLTGRAELSGQTLNTMLSGNYGASPFQLDAVAPFDRARGRLGMIAWRGRVEHALAALRKAVVNPVAHEDMPMTLLAEGSCDPAAGWKLAANFESKPADEQSPGALRGNASWQNHGELQAKVVVKGAELSGTLRANRSYQGQAELTNEWGKSLAPWLQALGRTLPGGLGGAAHWRGEGDLTAKTHRGELALDGLSWQRDKLPEISAQGKVRYQWPQSFETQGLVLAVMAQQASLDARMADGELRIASFEWSDNGETIAKGSATLPVPRQGGELRAQLLEEKRPLQLDVTSEWIPLTKLQPWLPGRMAFDEAAQARLEIHLAGRTAEPSLKGALEIRRLRRDSTPKAPPLDVALRMNAEGGTFHAKGEIRAPDFTPATLEATLPWRVRQWIEQPQSLLDEALDAKATVPRIELARFTPLLPSLEKLAGQLTADLRVQGPLRELKADGSMVVRDGAFAWKNRSVPGVEKLNAELQATPQRIELKTLSATMAGGSMRGRGEVLLERDREPTVDVEFTGDHLPVLRNEAWIVRANVALNAKGPWKDARVGGSIDLVDSLFFRDIELLPIGMPFTTPTQPKLPKLDAKVTRAQSGLPKPFADWPLAVTVHTADPFLIRGNLARGRIDGQIAIGGTLGAPAPKGTAAVQDVVARLPFSTLDVKRGLIRFTPENGFDPVLDVRGTSMLRPYEIDVYAYGRASDPQLVLTSNPPLPENEILTLLATGTTSRELENADTASTRAIQLLIEEIRRGRVRYGRKLLPLLQMFDRVDFRVDEQDLYSGQRYTTATVELSDHWLLSAGFNQAGGSRGMIIYRLRFR